MPYITFNHGGESPPQGLYLVSVSGSESISELFHFELILESDSDTEIKPTDIIGQDVSVRMDYSDTDLQSDSDARFIHGIVNCFQIISSDNTSLRRYKIDLVPSLWFLTKKSNFQIFENQKSSKIISSILSDYAMVVSLPAGKIQREHCIQYLETDYEFVTRLMADEGFIFYFEHSESEHKLIIKDSNQYMSSGNLSIYQHVTDWNPAYTYISKSWEVGDYNYADTAESMDAKKSSDITGLSNTFNRNLDRITTAAAIAGNGDTLVIKRQKDILAGREDADHEVISVNSIFDGICAGASFSVEDSDKLPSGAQTDYVVIEASHQLNVGSRYTNSFKCIPSNLPYFAKAPAARHIVNGPMTAQVVESGGDKLGRVKVKFLYEGAGSEDVSSCWIRVAQVISGPSYGAMFTPRINEEVVVTFINGNPDRPLITGTLYNDTLKPHADYIGEKDKPTRNGFLTSFDGEKFNELYFEDKPGEELFHVSTDNNYERLVEANDTLTINQGERNITINKGDENETLTEGNQTTTLTKGDKTLTLKKGSHESTLDDGDKKVTVAKGDIKIEASAKNIEMEAGADIKAKAGTDVKVEAGSKMELKAGSKIELKVGGNSIKIDMAGIELKVGGNSVKIEQSGITVKGVMVKVEGSAMAELKSPMTTLSGDAMVTVKGGIVMIN